MTPGQRVRTKICGITRIEDAYALQSTQGPMPWASSSTRTVLVLLRRARHRKSSASWRRSRQRSDCSSTLTGNMFLLCWKRSSLDIIQFHGDVEPGFCRSFDRPYIKVVRMVHGVDLQEMCRHYADAAALLLDSYSETAHGGTGT